MTRQDNSNDFLYACSAESYFRNEFKLGNHVHLQVIQSGSSAGLQNKHEPERQYTSRRNEVAFRYYLVLVNKEARVYIMILLIYYLN